MSVRLISSDNEAFTLSIELARLSNRLHDMIDVNTNVEVEIPFLADDIDIVLQCVDLLNDNQVNVAGDYIFYQIEHQIFTYQSIERLPIEDLLSLIYIVDYLEIVPLIDVFTSLLTQHIPSDIPIDIPHASDNKINQMLASLTDFDFEYRDLSPDIIRYIRKHQFLNLFGGVEYTIADYLTVEQPKPELIRENHITSEYSTRRVILIKQKSVALPDGEGIIRLSNHELTSFHGIKYINVKDIKLTLNLSNNHLIDPYMDTYDVRAPFTHLNINQLNLSSNLIERLPDSFFNGLTQLTSLVIGGNRLRQIPKCISQLTTLTYLGLQRNYLTSINNEFSQLTELKWLHLEDNSISQLSQIAFIHNTKLVELNLKHNLLRNLSIEQFIMNPQLSLSLDFNAITDRQRSELNYYITVN